jgi:hypothetical protein
MTVLRWSIIYPATVTHSRQLTQFGGVRGGGFGAKWSNSNTNCGRVSMYTNTMFWYPMLEFATVAIWRQSRSRVSMNDASSKFDSRGFPLHFSQPSSSAPGRNMKRLSPQTMPTRHVEHPNLRKLFGGRDTSAHRLAVNSRLDPG